MNDLQFKKKKLKIDNLKFDENNRKSKENNQQSNKNGLQSNKITKIQDKKSKLEYKIMSKNNGQPNSEFEFENSQFNIQIEKLKNNLQSSKPIESQINTQDKNCLKDKKILKNNNSNENFVKGKNDDEIKDILKLIRRRKFKINCVHIDFINELGYKRYIQLAITKIFSFLNEKELTAAFCVSKKWNHVLNQNGYLFKRRINYLKIQEELKSKIGLENWPIKKKNLTKSGRRVFGEMTNKKFAINRLI